MRVRDWNNGYPFNIASLDLNLLYWPFGPQGTLMPSGLNQPDYEVQTPRIFFSYTYIKPGSMVLTRSKSKLADGQRHSTPSISENPTFRRFEKSHRPSITSLSDLCSDLSSLSDLDPDSTLDHLTDVDIAGRKSPCVSSLNSQYPITCAC